MYQQPFYCDAVYLKTFTEAQIKQECVVLVCQEWDNKPKVIVTSVIILALAFATSYLLLFNDCSSAGCMNDGTCVDYINGYSCRCPNGFSGKNFSTEMSVFCYQYCQWFPILTQSDSRRQLRRGRKAKNHYPQCYGPADQPHNTFRLSLTELGSIRIGTGIFLLLWAVPVPSFYFFVKNLWE